MELPDSLRDLLGNGTGSQSAPDTTTTIDDRATALDGGQVVADGEDEIAIELPGDADVDAAQIEAALNGNAGSLNVKGQAGGDTTVTPVASDSDINITDSAFDLSDWEHKAFLDDRITTLMDNRVDYNQETAKWILANDDLIPGILIRLKSLILGKQGLEPKPADPDSDADQKLAEHLEAVYRGDADVESHIEAHRVVDRVLEQNVMNAVWVGRSTDLQHLDISDLEYVKDGETGEELYIQGPTSYTTFDIEEDGDPSVEIAHKDEPTALELGEQVLDVRLYRTPPLQAVADDVVNKMQLKHLQGRKAEIASIGGVIIKVNPPAWLDEADYDQYVKAEDSQFGDESGRLLELVMAQQIEAALSTLEDYQTATVMSIPENWETETIELPEMDESMSDMIRDHNEAISRRLLLPLDLIELKEGPELSRNSMMQMFLDQITGWQGQITDMFDRFAQVQADIHGMGGEVEHELPSIAAEDEKQITELLNFAGLMGLSESEARELANTFEGVDLETDQTGDMPPEGGPEDRQDRIQQMQDALQEGGDGQDGPPPSDDAGGGPAGQQAAAGTTEASGGSDSGNGNRGGGESERIELPTTCRQCDERTRIQGSFYCPDCHPSKEADGFDGELVAEDPEVGFETLPDGWDRQSVLDAWTSLGGSFTSCKRDMMADGKTERFADRFCAALKDEVLQTEEWREGANGEAVQANTPDTPQPPDAPTQRLRDLWKELVNRAATDVDDRLSIEAVQVRADWNPALHPRGPDGKFVERPWDVPDSILGMDTGEIVRELAENDPDFAEKVDELQIDGVLNFEDDLQDARERIEEQDADLDPGDTDTPDVDLPESPEEAADVVLEALREDEGFEPRGSWEDLRENWEQNFRGGFDNLDPEMQQALETAQMQNRENDTWQELVDTTDVSTAAIHFDPSGANEEGGNIRWNEHAQAERKARVSMLYSQPLGTTSTDPDTPQPGEGATSQDVASILRHEQAHDMWDETDREFRDWFRDELEAIEEADITSYAADERPEESFTELLTIRTNPEYDPEEFPDEVSNLGDELVERVPEAVERAAQPDEDEGFDLPGPELPAADVEVGQEVGVKDDLGEVRYGTVTDVYEHEGTPFAEVDLGDGERTLLGDTEDPPRKMFDPPGEPDLPDAVDITEAVDSETSDYSDNIQIHELPDGSEVYEKQMERDRVVDDFPWNHPDEHLAEANRSVAASEVMQQAGVDVPTHHFDEDRGSLLVEGVDGQDVMDFDGNTADQVDRDAFVEVMAGSVLTGNRDIHGGNFVVDEETGYPHPIDQGLSAVELDEKKFDGMAESATNLAKQFSRHNDAGQGIEITPDEIQQRATEMASELDVEEIRDSLDARGVPDHWKQNLVNNIRTIEELADDVADTEEVDTSLPDDLGSPPEPELPDEPDVPLERGGVRPVDGSQPGQEIAQTIPDMAERFEDELDVDDDIPSTSRIDPDTRQEAIEIIGQDLDRMRDAEMRETVAGRISHVDGPGEESNAGHAIVTSYPFFDDDEERARMSAVMLGDGSAAGVASHEFQHATDNSMGYDWGGEHSGRNGGFHDYSTSDPFEGTSSSGSSAADAMMKDISGDGDTPVGLEQWADEARQEVQFDADGRPESLDPDAIEERLTDRNPNAPLEERYRRFVSEVNRAWFKSQEAYNQEGKKAADKMIHRPYQMTNAGEFSAVFATTMQKQDMQHSFAIPNYIEHHPGLVAAWVDLYEPDESVMEEIQRQARRKGVEI